MLDTFFLEKLDAESKKKILENEHQMEMTRELKGGINAMCNVSLGIKERAFAEGIETGAKQKLYQQIQKKLSKGQSAEEIAEDLMEDIETITSIIKEIAAQK